MTDDTVDAPDTVERRRPGRPKGSPKVPGSGRKPGQVNTLTRDIKELILKRGRPLELLCDVCRGLKIRVGPQAGPDATYIFPTMQDRLAAARTLLAKVIPDVKAIELAGPDGGPIETADATEIAAARAAALVRLGEALGAGRPTSPTVSAENASVAPPRPVALPAEPAPAPAADAAAGLTTAAQDIDPDVPPGYTLQPTPDGVRVLHQGAAVFHAASRADALTFVGQHGSLS